MRVSELLIDGRAVEGEGPPLDVFNPATEERIAVCPTASLAQLDASFAAARRAFDEGPWPHMAPAERSRALHRVADALEARADEFLQVLVTEVGTPVSLARIIHINGALANLREFADLAAVDRTQHLGEHAGPPRSASLVAYRPAGVVSAITAYNYPVTIGAWKVGGALAAGCTAVLLPSPRTPLATLLFGEVLRDAELPPGVINVVAGAPDLGRAATERGDVDRISFTGSVAVGQAIMRQAAQSLANPILELGGKSANVVLPDYELTKAAIATMHLRYLRNAGQGCASPTRILVHEDRLDEFLALTREVYAEVRTGDPWDEDVVVGPLVRPEQRDSVLGFVERAVDEGGEVVAGGGKPALERGWYVNPTLIAGLGPDAELAQNEAFGPVGVLLTYRSVDEAIRIANDTPYGLAAYVSASTIEEGQAVAARLRAGTVAINGGGAQRPDAPFGGFKASGIGREGGEWGIREFLEAQHVQWAL
jgi:aldehyde dehydrogenase (NAD+)/betaine-aldehyde dehydrogenase